MREFFRSKGFKFLLALIAFLVGIMIYAVTKGGYSVSGKSIINTLSKPFRMVSNHISMTIENTAERVAEAEEIYQENQSLKDELTRLQEELSEYESLKIENEELRMLIGIKKAHPDLTTSRFCKVLGYVTNDPFKSFTINVGKADGIEPDCPVATAEGIVGMTIEVSEHVTTVRSILSPDLSIAVRSSENESDAGIIEGSVKSAGEELTNLIHLRTDNTLEKNDLLITDGSSGLFPKGYSVGTVKNVSMDSNGISARATIKPCVDVTNLESVFVITDFTGKRGSADED
ncbi:MAG: rod shape-determining protein MreC [Ruminococcus sp.]|nr:rod shape-determining protein MreC [Ruminococcus sp.]